VAAVDNLEEGNLRVTGQVDVLSAVGYELHKSSSHFSILYYMLRKKFWNMSH
jgi:hypothetical protein